MIDSGNGGSSHSSDHSPCPELSHEGGEVREEPLSKRFCHLNRLYAIDALLRHVCEAPLTHFCVNCNGYSLIANATCQVDSQWAWLPTCG